MIAHPKPSLLFGSIELADDLTGWNADYVIEALGDDSTWGNPQPIEVAVKSLLQDGSIVATTGHDNREATFRVTVKANDGIGLALGEAALNAEVGRLNTLTWTPPDGFGPPTVFEVVTSSLEHVFDDMSELQVERTYGLRLICQPFGRSVDETTAAAVGVVETFGTARQQRRTFDIGGSARTQAVVEVESPGGSALGWTVVYTGSADAIGGGAVPMRQYRTAASDGAATTDAGRVSGAYDAVPLNGWLRFDVPTAQIEPGAYQVVGLMRATGGAKTDVPFTLNELTYISGKVANYQDYNTRANIPAAWAPVPIGLVDLPSVRLGDTAAGTSYIEIRATGLSDLQVDEVWLFNTERGAMTIVDATTSTNPSFALPASRVSILPPDVTHPTKRVLLSAAANRSDERHVPMDRLTSWSGHSFPPGSLSLFTVTTGATDTTAALRYFRRWHTHAAE